jgi:hypothetical protein
MKQPTKPAALRIPLLVLVCLGFAGAALAQQPTQAQINAIRQSCRADYQTYCASVPPGGAASLSCLKQNSPSLSAACQQAVNAVSGGAPPSPTQGAAPAPTAPATVGPAPAPPHAASPPLTPRQELGLLRRACGPDVRTYCPGVPPGGGRILSCLEANVPNLSQQCRSALIAARQRG